MKARKAGVAIGVCDSTEEGAADGTVWELEIGRIGGAVEAIVVAEVWQIWAKKLGEEI